MVGRRIKKIVFIITITAVMTGCTSVPTEIVPIETAKTQPAVFTTPPIYKFPIAAGADWHAQGNGLVTEINAQIPAVFSSIKETESLMESLDLLTSGKAGMAFVYDYHVVLANQGKLTTAFPDAPMEKIAIKCGTEMTRPVFPEYPEAARIVLPLYEEPLHIVVSKTAGITSVNDLKGRHISTGEEGSATEQQARAIFASLGIDWEKEISREQLGLPAAVDALENSELDAFFWSGILSDAGLSEFLKAKGAEIKLISITGEEAEKIIQANPGIFHRSEISAGTYNSNQENVDTLATTVVLAAMEDFPENHVPLILTVLFTHSSANWKSRIPPSPEASFALLNAESRLYLHPGTLNYFVEQGISE